MNIEEYYKIYNISQSLMDHFDFQQYYDIEPRISSETLNSIEGVFRSVETNFFTMVIEKYILTRGETGSDFSELYQFVDRLREDGFEYEKYVPNFVLAAYFTALDKEADNIDKRQELYEYFKKDIGEGRYFVLDKADILGQEETAVEPEPVAEEEPAVEEVEDTPVEEAVEETPVVEPEPVVEEVPAANEVVETPIEEIVEKTPAVEPEPVVEEAPVVEEKRKTKPKKLSKKEERYLDAISKIKGLCKEQCFDTDIAKIILDHDGYDEYALITYGLSNLEETEILFGYDRDADEEHIDNCFDNLDQLDYIDEDMLGIINKSISTFLNKYFCYVEEDLKKHDLLYRAKDFSFAVSTVLYRMKHIDLIEDASSYNVAIMKRIVPAIVDYYDNGISKRVNFKSEDNSSKDYIGYMTRSNDLLDAMRELVETFGDGRDEIIVKLAMRILKDQAMLKYTLIEGVVLPLKDKLLTKHMINSSFWNERAKTLTALLRKEAKEARAKQIADYWVEHADQKQKLEQEQIMLRKRLAQLNEALKNIEEDYNKKYSFIRDHETKAKAELLSLGILAFKRKKELNADLEAMKNKYSEILLEKNNRTQRCNNEMKAVDSRLKQILDMLRNPFGKAKGEK